VSCPHLISVIWPKKFIYGPLSHPLSHNTATQVSLKPGWGVFFLFFSGRQVLEGYIYLETNDRKKCILFVTSLE